MALLNKCRKEASQLVPEQMSLIESGDEAEFAAAVAATAFAITSLQTDGLDQWEIKRPDRELATGETSEASKPSQDVMMEELPPQLEFIMPVRGIPEIPPLKIERNLPKDPERPPIGQTPSMQQKLSSGDQPSEEEAERIKPPERIPTVKKTPIFSDEGLKDAKRMKPTDTVPPPVRPPAVPPLHIEQSPKKQRPKDQETDADVWEREEMARIKERYEKLNATILEWEEKKKQKARKKLEETEREVEKRRAKAMQKHQTDLEQIQQIADGARAQAKEKQRAEESKTKGTTNRYEELSATIYEWEEKNKKKVSRKLRMTEVELENKRTKARQRFHIDTEQIKEIADGARAQAKEKLRNEESKVKEKASRYRATGEPPLQPLCQCM